VESPTSTKASSQDEENEAKPNGMTQEENMHVEELLRFKGGCQEN
jgi:hypothetical protein